MQKYKAKNMLALRDRRKCNIFFYFILFNFTILYWFCQISKWICHRYTCVPHPELSSLLPPHTIPLGRPSAPAPSIQYRASNLGWQLVSYIILYIFQCHSPKSSHPQSFGLCGRKYNIFKIVNLWEHLEFFKCPNTFFSSPQCKCNFLLPK